MGVSIYSNQSIYEFDMGYATFFRLRTLIATMIDKELGEAYGESLYQKSRAEDIKEVLDRKRLADRYKDVIDFLFMSDCGGSISHKVCRQLYELLKNVSREQSLDYVRFRSGDWYDFKAFLMECYSKHRKMRWA